MIDYKGVCSIAGPRRIYGGTRFTYEMLMDDKFGKTDNSNEKTSLVIFNLCDLPFCLMTDTILLPFTTYHAIIYNTDEKQRQWELEIYCDLSQ